MEFMAILLYRFPRMRRRRKKGGGGGRKRAIRQKPQRFSLPFYPSNERACENCVKKRKKRIKKEEGREGFLSSDVSVYSLLMGADEEGKEKGGEPHRKKGKRKAGCERGSIPVYFQREMSAGEKRREKKKNIIIRKRGGEKGGGKHRAARL